MSRVLIVLTAMCSHAIVQLLFLLELMVKTLTIRNISSNVYETLREQARSQHRSMQEQIRWILAKEASLFGRTKADSAKKWRERLAERSQTSAVEDIRSMRDER